MVLAIKLEDLGSILASWWKEVLFRPPHTGCDMHTHILILASLLLSPFSQIKNKQTTNFHHGAAVVIAFRQIPSQP